MSKQLFALCVAGATALAALIVGCQSTSVSNSNTNMTNANTATSVTTTPTVSPTATDASRMIDANEPDEYSATLVLTAATTGGERVAAIPQLTADVARSEDGRRVSFNLPKGEKVVYLNRGNTRYLILPDRKQYAELMAEAVGFELPRLMMPDQLVDYLEKQPGYERVGEDQLDGRAVIKYRAAGTTRTGTQAGDVRAESFVYVDKETELPLRVELASQATGNVQGVQGLRVVVEMRDIKREVEPSLFEVPQGLNKVTAEQVRSQVNAVVRTASAIAGALLNSMNNASPTAR